MRQLQLRGGLRVGRVNTSVPLVKLTVDHDELEISGGLSGHFTFRPEDIIRLEGHSIFPLLGRRIKIVHRVPHYPGDIHFLTFRQPEVLLEEIRKTGFLASINPAITPEDERIMAQQKKASRFPLNLLFVLGLLGLYHAGIFYYLINSGGNIRVEEMGNYFSLGGLLVIAVGIGLLISEPLRKIAFRPGATTQQAKSSIYVLIIFGLLAALINAVAFSNMVTG